MIFNKKDIAKMSLIAIVIGCAVTICNLFLNFYIDLTILNADIINAAMQQYYDAMVTTCASVSGISGGSMVSVAVVMIIFLIRNFVDSHGKELGTLKALGYSPGRIAVKFVPFGAAAFIGSGIGYLVSLIIMPSFYDAQNADALFFTVKQNIHPELLIFLIVLPSIFFVVIAVLFANLRLRKSALTLIRGEEKERKIKKVHKVKPDVTFLKGMSSSVLYGNKILLFFAIFAPFCFSCNLQMGLAMNEYTSPLMGALMIVIGVIIAAIIILLALSAIVKGNEKSIAMMRVTGYSYGECKKAVLDIYRPFGYIGFVLGTGYQAGLLSYMINVIFKDIGDVSTYTFGLEGLFIAAVLFVFLYEGVLYIFSKRIEKVDLKQIMLE